MTKPIPSPSAPPNPEVSGPGPVPPRRLPHRSGNLIRRGATLACLLALGLGAHPILAAGAHPAEFFVSPNGSDNAPGTQEKPFATLERARDAVRALKKQAGTPAGGVTVWLRDGDHLRTTAFELGPTDGGEPGAPVRYQGWPGERPRLLGGRVLTGFRTVTESTVQDRLPPDARGKVVSVDLRKAGLTEFGAMKSRGFSRPAEAAHCEFFFHGRPMTLARWPNEGAFEKIAGFPEAAGQGDEHGGTLGKLQEGFRYDGDRPRRWKSTEDIWVHGYWAWDWANSYERIASIDLEQRLVRTAPPHGVYGFRKGQRFHFLNILEELDQPGEYYLDRKSGFLYFWPPTALEASEALLSLLDQPVIRVQKAAHLEIRSLRIEASRTTGIEISSSVQCRVESCDLRNLGNSGVIISGGSSNSVAACNVSDTGDGGVSLSGGDRKSLTASGHSVENTLFERQGRWSKCYVPAIGIEGVGQRASHNVIRNHPHCAILFGGNDHLMEFNEIHHIALETGDVGAIYTGRDYTYRGNRIRHNFIHHTGGVGMGSMGVYMDDCVSGTEVYGNVFYKVHWAMFIGGGRDMRVDNNIFVDCDPAVRADGRGLDRSPVWRNMVDRTMRDRLNDAPLDLYRQRYPAMRSLDAHYGPPQGPAIQGEAFHGVPPEGNVIRRNLCVGKWIDIGWQAKPEMFDVRDNQVGGDPGFVSVEKMDFRLKPGAGPLPPGFDPVPFERMGLENTPARRAVEALLTPQ